jgi:prolyl-tRNA editing enzyme YbaK/EbsC (Cys-tRNA(Pro) deacylase)
LKRVNAWPAAVERVAAFLRDTGAEARVEEFAEGTPTAADAARAIGCPLAHIVKSLVFECDGDALLVLVPGDRRADPRKVARAAGSARAAVAGPDRVRAVTGFEPGAVAPFPVPLTVRVLIERTLLVRDPLWIGAGSPNHMAALPPSELVRLARATPVDVAEDG